MLSETNQQDAFIRDEMAEEEPGMVDWLTDFYRMRNGQTPVSEQTAEWQEAMGAAAGAFERLQVSLQMAALRKPGL